MNTAHDLMAMARLAEAFTPTRPIALPDFLSGRLNLIRRLMVDIATPSQHVLIHGDRGVGKTSIARVLAYLAQEPEEPHGRRSIIVSCDAEDTYGSIWRKVLQEILLAERQLGFEQHHDRTIVGRWSPDDDIEVPNDVRLLLGLLPNPTTVVIDEFDRIEPGGNAHRLMTDTIKLFSDSVTPCSIVLVGVGQSIEQLIAAHESISRNMDYLAVDPLHPSELAQVIQRGMATAGMTIDEGLDYKIAQLSQGYPHYTHLLGLWSGSAAIDRGSRNISLEDLKAAITSSIEHAAGGIRVEYDKATDSTQPNNLFKQVLLACALAEKDARGRFSLSAVYEPLQEIVHPRNVGRSSFQRHLALFCEPDHGPVLVKTGRRKNYRWHFANPQLVPFVCLRGIEEGFIQGNQYFDIEL